MKTGIQTSCSGKCAAMKINIDKESLIGDIQKQFTAHYSFLKIQFHKKRSSDKRFIREEPAAPCELFRNLSGTDKTGIVNINCKRSIADVENEFKNKYGVDAEILRKSGTLWIETSLTDDWSLEKQNKEGEQISSHTAIIIKHNADSIINYLGNQNREAAG